MLGAVLYGTWGWYKEAVTTGNNTDTEAKRCVQDGCEVMSLEYVPFSFAKFFGIIPNCRGVASPCLPTDDVSTEEGDLKPSQPVSCFFGPFKSQIRQYIKISEVFPCVSVYHIYSGLTD